MLLSTYIVNTRSCFLFLSFFYSLSSLTFLALLPLELESGIKVDFCLGFWNPMFYLAFLISWVVSLMAMQEKVLPIALEVEKKASTLVEAEVPINFDGASQSSPVEEPARAPDSPVLWIPRSLRNSNKGNAWQMPYTWVENDTQGIWLLLLGDLMLSTLSTKFSYRS